MTLRCLLLGHDWRRAQESRYEWLEVCRGTRVPLRHRYEVLRCECCGKEKALP